MFGLIFKAGLWLIGGKSWWSNLVTAGSIAIAAAGGGYVSGYYKGHNSAAHFAEVETLKHRASQLQSEIDQRDDADMLAEHLAAEAAAIEASNGNVSDEIESAIAARPPVPECVSGGFLAGLRKLQ